MEVNSYYDTFITITYNVNNEGGGSYSGFVSKTYFE